MCPPSSFVKITFTVVPYGGPQTLYIRCWCISYSVYYSILLSYICIIECILFDITFIYIILYIYNIVLLSYILTHNFFLGYMSKK